MPGRSAPSARRRVAATECASHALARTGDIGSDLKKRVFANAAADTALCLTIRFRLFVAAPCAAVVN